MPVVRHVGIVVSDLERSLSFYRDVLGLTVVRRLEEAGEHLDQMLALPQVRVTTVKLAAAEGPTLVELLKFESPTSPAAPHRELHALGPTHVAFTVADVEALYRRLSRQGVQFTAPPQRSPDGYAKVAFCFDPDGVPLELVEVLTPNGSPPAAAATAP